MTKCLFQSSRDSIPPRHRFSICSTSPHMLDQSLTGEVRCLAKCSRGFNELWAKKKNKPPTARLCHPHDKPNSATEHPEPSFAGRMSIHRTPTSSQRNPSKNSIGALLGQSVDRCPEPRWMSTSSRTKNAGGPLAPRSNCSIENCSESQKGIQFSVTCTI